MKIIEGIGIGILAGAIICYVVMTIKHKGDFVPVNNDSINAVVKDLKDKEIIFADSIAILKQNISMLEYQKKLLHEKYKNYTVNDAVLWLDSFERANSLY